MRDEAGVRSRMARAALAGVILLGLGVRIAWLMAGRGNLPPGFQEAMEAENIPAVPETPLDEIVAAMSRAGIEGSRTAVWRFYERHAITYKKNVVRSRAKTRRCDSRAPTLDARAGHVRPGTVGLYR